MRSGELLQMKRVGVHFIVLCVCFALPGVGVINTDAEPALRETNYSVRRQVQYSFTLRNRTNRLLKKAAFWTYAPVKETATQRCVRLEASHPYELILDDLGNQILHFTFNNLPPYATKIVTIKADLKLCDTPNLTSVQDLQPFLRAEKYLESDDPELCQFAEKFQDPELVKIAEKIFRWVADHVQHTGYLPNERGALYALRNKQGDCTEFAYLFAALCRANAIPARGIGGYVCTENKVIKPNDYHNWAEFYQDGAWRIADPHRKVFMQDQFHYIAMKLFGESPKNPMGSFHRFRFSGDGLKVKMNK